MSKADHFINIQKTKFPISADCWFEASAKYKS